MERGIRLILLGLINSMSSQAMARPEFPEIIRPVREEVEPEAYERHLKSTACSVANARIVREDAAPIPELELEKQR
jgi:hypothetical protein